MSYKQVGSVLGNVLISLSVALLIPLVVAFLDDDGSARAFALSAGISFVIGISLRRRDPQSDPPTRQAFIIVTLGWLVVALAAALPFVWTGAVPTYVDALFEAMSGVTTTGATVIPDIEQIPRSILFWRSLLQWLGGMGFIVLSIAVLPRLASGSMELFKAEVPSPLPERIKPRLRETALFLWRLYIVLTVVLIALLKWGGLDWFDAVSHALSTLASGGFSTRNASIAAYDNVIIEVVLIIFMIIAGTNFSLFYHTLRTRNVMQLIRDLEFRVYIFTLMIASVLICWNLWSVQEYTFSGALRYGSFQVVSVMTTTGFATADYNHWPPFASFILFLLMFVGGSGGSTTGSVKVLRYIIIAKHGYRELFRLIHPRAVKVVRVGTETIGESAITRILMFIIFYFGIFGIGVIIMTAFGLDLVTAASAAGAAIGNIGPGFGRIGPMENFAYLAPPIKLILSFLMLIGRLEIYTVLILFVPSFWARNRAKHHE